MHHIFIHSSVDGHLGYFCILTVVNSATVNMRMHVFFFFCVPCRKIWNASRICVSSLRRGHVNLLCIVPILVYVLPKRARMYLFESVFWFFTNIYPKLSFLNYTVLQSYSTQNNMVLAHTKRHEDQ